MTLQALAWLGIGVAATATGIMILRHYDRKARHTAWRVDHERRQWSKGVEDALPWKWPVKS